jgi:hypothetical protein
MTTLAQNQAMDDRRLMGWASATQDLTQRKRSGRKCLGMMKLKQIKTIAIDVLKEGCSWKLFSPQESAWQAFLESCSAASVRKAWALMD